MKIRRRSGILAAVGAAVLTLSTTACGGSGGGGSATHPSSVAIGIGIGIDNLSAIVVQEEGWLQKAYPGLKVSLKQFSSGSAQTDALIADQIQISAQSATTYFVGLDKGIPWKLLASSDQQPLWLVTNDPSIHSLKDLAAPGKKIAVPSPTSIQATTLKKAALEQLGNAKAFNNNFVSLGHSTAYQALKSHQVAADFGSAPYQFEEVAAGGRVLVNSYNIWGRHNLGFQVTTTSLYSQYPSFFAKYVSLLNQADALISRSPSQAAALYEKSQGSSPDLLKSITANGIYFDTKLYGVLAMGRFMAQIGQIKHAPNSMSAISFPTVPKGSS